MNSSNHIQSVELCYQRAAAIQAAVNNMDVVAMNTTIIPHWIDDSDFFWYRRTTDNGFEFRLVDPDSGTNTLAFDHQVLAKSLSKVLGQDIDSNRLPITNVCIVISPVVIRFKAFGGDYTFDSINGDCKISVATLNQYSSDVLESPDRTKLAFCRDYNLWIRDLSSGKEYPITQDGEQYYCYASSPISWGRALNSNLQALWSPDSKSLFTVQTDNRQVNMTPVITYVPEGDIIRPQVKTYPQAYPGDIHVEEMRLVIIDAETAVQTEINYRRIPVNRTGWGLFTDGLGWWSESSNLAYFVETTRGESTARVVEVDRGNGKTRVLFEEQSESYVKLSLNRDSYATIMPLPTTRELIWYSERTGWAHLYLYDLETGELKNPITNGNWVVREVLHFDINNRQLYFQSSGRETDKDPYYLDICRVNIDTGQITKIACTDHEYSVLGPRGLQSLICSFGDPDTQANSYGVSPSGRYIVAARSSADQVPVSILLDYKGKLISEFEEAQLTSVGSTWVWPEPFEATAADGETSIFGVFFRPSDMSSDKKYPIIDASICSPEFCGVPKGSFSNAELGGTWYLQSAALAELGFIVVMIEGRGTPYRSKEFSDFSYGSIDKINFGEDRIAGIKALSGRYDFMDINRVGIMGFNGMPGAVLGMLQYPNFYKVGVSHALQDCRINAAIIGEALKGIRKPGDYSSPPERLVENLQGKLLLMHGLLDVMDHSAATWRLVHALQEANKDFDMLILPNEGKVEHIGSMYAFRRTWDYFVRHLQGFEPPREFKLG